MAIRLSGMNSGLDTENIISELVKAKSVKKDKLVKAQTKLQWKQDAWKELNTKVYNLYSKTLGNMRLKSDYSKKSTKVSDSTAATVITGSNAVNGVQTLQVNKLATTGYLTGGKLSETGEYSGSSTMKDLGLTGTNKLSMTVGGKTTEIVLSETTTINDFVSQLKKAGVNANFDAKNQRFFISAKETGKEADFSLAAANADSKDALAKLGLATSLKDDTATYNYYLKYCDVVKDADGKITGYTQKTDLSALITEEQNSRLARYKEEYNSLQTAITKNETKTDEKKQELIDKYGADSDFWEKSADNLTTELETAKSSLATLEEEKKDATEGAWTEDNQKELEAAQEAVKKAETALADKKAWTELETEATELQAKLTENAEYYTPDSNGGLGTATQKLLNEVDADVNAQAVYAQQALDASLTSSSVSNGATRIAGQDAVITLNGAEFTSTSNNFEINGLTITANRETKENESITLTTSDDTDGIYDMVKNFLKEYNALINEMDKLYSADSTKGYEPLTEEEKEAMSEKEIEKWEEKIKDSILRKDSTLNSVASAMKQIMSSGITIGGETLYLSSFGISTAGYFSSAENEKNAYHIDGDPDDITTSTKADKLKTAIANDPEKVTEFFSALTLKLYEKLGDMMKSTEYSSAFTLYDDKAMKTEYNEYKDKISAQEQKISDYEDRYYKKFTAMESALAKLSAKESAVSGLFG